MNQKPFLRTVTRVGLSAGLLLALLAAGCAAPQVYAPLPRSVSRPPVHRPLTAGGRCDVVVDAGHGGTQLGARGFRGLKEKMITLDIAQRLKRYLQDAGLRVMMTRGGDQTVSLWQRSHIASVSGAWSFVSIHANANPDRSAAGCEVYYLPAQRRPTRGIGSSYQLARAIQTQFQRDWPMKNRGIKQARFYVLRRTPIPAALVEVGFLTNPREEALLRNPAFREEIAKRLAQAVISYRGQIARLE